MPDLTRSDLASQSTQQVGFKIGQQLYQSAKAASRNYTQGYYEDKKFAIGENQWPTPSSYRAYYRSRWKNQSVRNYTYATINHKIAVLMGADNTVKVEPLNEMVTLEERTAIANVVKHQATRMRWQDYTYGALFDGSILGKGIVHIYPERDEFSGHYEIKSELVDPNRFYPDPTKSLLHECRYIVYEPDMNMSQARTVFPKTWQLINPTGKEIGRMGEVTYNRSQDELLYGPATGDITITRDGIIQERRADVSFVWIKDGSVASDLKDVLIRDPQPGNKCVNCGQEFANEEANSAPDLQRACPSCDGTSLEPVMLAPQFQTVSDTRRMYPYGRLICMTKDALLYDGPSEYQLRQIFPFATYDHYRITGRFWGYGEVAMVKKVQEALNKNIAQGIDFMRMAGMGPMEVPAEVAAYRKLGNTPGDQIPVPAAFMGLARYISPTGYNPQMHQILDQSLKADMQELTGVNETSRGDAPLNPSSGREVVALQQAAQTRMGLHLENKSDYESEYLDIVYQMMNQFYREPRAFQVQTPDGEFESIVVTVNSLPQDVQVRVNASLEQAERDANMGQNLMQFVQGGGLDSPYADLLLRLIARDDPGMVREFVERSGQVRQQQAQQQAMQPQVQPQQPMEMPNGG